MTRTRRPRGLDAIVPGKDPDPNDGLVDIPTFDLGQQIKANDRKVAASKRKGPKAKQDDPTVSPTDQQEAYSPWRPVMTEQQRQVIAQIVERDIQQLSEGQQIASL